MPYAIYLPSGQYQNSNINIYAAIMQIKFKSKRTGRSLGSVATELPSLGWQGGGRTWAAGNCYRLLSFNLIVLITRLFASFPLSASALAILFNCSWEKSNARMRPFGQVSPGHLAIYVVGLLAFFSSLFGPLVLPHAQLDTCPKEAVVVVVVVATGARRLCLC